MPKDFQQTDTDAPLGPTAANSGRSLCNTNIDLTAEDGGTAGTNTNTPKFSNPQANPEVFWGIEVDPGEDVPSGDHVIRMRVTGTNTSVTWSEAYVCYWNGSSWETPLGSDVAVGHVIDTAQTESVTINCNAGPTYASSHRLYYILIGTSAGAHGNNTFTFVSDQLITTPITVAAANTPYYYNRLLGYGAS